MFCDPHATKTLSRLLLSRRKFNMGSSSIEASISCSSEQEPLDCFGHADDDIAFADYSYKSADVHDDTETIHATKARPCLQSGNIILKAWKLEFLCCFVALVLFVVVVIIVYMHNGHELSSWRAPIAMSSLLSFISSAIRALLSITLGVGISQLKWHHFDKTKPATELVVYDEASRNIFGIFGLLRTRE